MGTCEWCGEVKVAGFHLSSLSAGLAAGLGTYLILGLIK